MADTCKDHPQRPMLAACGTCRRRLCEACWAFRLDDHPACARCAFEVSSRPARRVSLAIAFVGFAFGGGVWAWRHHRLVERDPIPFAIGVVATLVIGVLIALSGRNAPSHKLERRDSDDDAPPSSAAEAAPPAPRGNPYRARARRLLMAAAPKVSGTATALVVFASLVVSSILVPNALHLPRWIEAEIVLGILWLSLGSTLAVLLYRGFRLRDDFVYFAPWARPAKGSNPPKSKKSSSWGLDGCSDIGGCGDFSGCGDGCGDLGGDGEGVLIVLVVVVALGAALAAAWILVELALPLLFLLVYALFMRAVGRAAKDTHGCAGSFAKSTGWGALWATIYVAPIGLLTFALHAALKKHGF